MINWFINTFKNSPERVFIGGAIAFMLLAISSFYQAYTAETFTSLAIHSASAGAFSTSTFYYGLFIFQQKMNNYLNAENNELKAKLKSINNDHQT